MSFYREFIWHFTPINGIFLSFFVLELLVFEWKLFYCLSDRQPLVLVHGGLCAAKLPRQQDRVHQHVREAHPERPVHRLHPQR